MSDVQITIPGWMLGILVVFVPSTLVGLATLPFATPFEALLVGVSCVGGFSAFLSWMHRSRD